MSHKKQNFLEGALILTISALIVKAVGALFKIPLAIILGGSGMAYFMTAYDLFSPVYALSVAGLPVAVSKLVSENCARKRYRDVKRIFRIAFLLFLVSGAACSLLMLGAAKPFVEAVGNPDAVYAVMAMAPAIFFGCVLSAYRGYYQGLNNMLPTALSQVVEVICKLVLGIGLALFISRWGIQQYEASGIVFGRAVQTLVEAQRRILPFAAAGAVLGVSLSTLCGTIYLIFLHRLRGDGLSRETVKASPYPAARRDTFRSLVRIALPVCLGSLIAHLTTIVDLATIMKRLGVAVLHGEEIILSMYPGMIPQGENIPVYLYGSYTGLAVSLFNLVPSLTAAIGVSALPSIASSWSTNNKRKTGESIRSVLAVTAILAVPMGLGLSALSEPILNLLFSARPQEAALVAPLLRVMGVAAIFIAMANPVSSMLQAVGRADIPVKLMFFGILLKGACNWILVADPRINIKGAPVGTLVCYCFIFIFSLYFLCKETAVRVDLAALLKPLAAGALCACSAALCIRLAGTAASGVVTILAIAVGCAIYLFTLIFLKGITENELLLVPNGEKIVKTLEKFSLLG